MTLTFRPRSVSMAGLVVLACLALTAAMPARAARALPDFTELVEAQSDAVVNISTVTRAGGTNGLPQGIDPEQLPEFFRHFFRGMPEGPQRERRSLGSGFILSEDGYVVTNNHVVEDADEIFVRLVDRREFEAEIVGTDPRSDIALLKLDAADLPAVEVGRSAELEVGEWVLAIGSPFGFDYSVTAGIVSAKGRSLPTERNENYVPFIQTDVAINPGNSGGPLFDLDGRVVGINSQIYTRSGGFMGLSFAIPIDVAMDVIDQLKETGSVSRGWLGVMIQDVTRDLAEAFGLDKPAGALVARVIEGSPAAEAGIRAGDIITTFNGREVEVSSDLPHLVGRVEPGREVPLDVVRDGERIQLEVELGELAARERRAGGPGGPSATLLGLTVEPVPEEALSGLDAEGGVRVTQVRAGPAADAGIVAGDIITELDGVAVRSIDDFRTAVAELPRGQWVRALIVRGGTPTFVPLRVPAEE